MRLNQIKLAGFKSFAEPTTFMLPGQRVGVVGPNGCGKSNIMDAVRWVLGESKASELRGQSMQDVIFNGSGLRKPANRASVELVFSNEDARAGGQWNQYTEIAVKRVLTRDGNSSYFINNQAVRRRDVQDVFLGTGLGPRAYAIIGQGTISRIIESRPEELRLFLEEAAGVSKYKERRRETEVRLRDTRENLTRVDDILRELHGQLERLQRQAAVASQFRDLQTAGTRKLHQLWFLKHRDANQEATRVQQAMGAATSALELRLAELRQVEAGQETLRQAHYAASDGLHAAQGELAEAALSVSRLEERIRYATESRRRTEARLNELQIQAAQWADRRTQAQAESETTGGEIDAAQARAGRLAAQAEDAQQRLSVDAEALRNAQSQAGGQRGAVAQVQQQIQLLAADSRHVDEQARALRQRGERLQAESRQLSPPDLPRLLALREQFAAADAARLAADAALQQLQDQSPLREQARTAAQHDAQAQAARLADIGARLAALRALQDKVQTNGKLRPWLVRHGLASLPALWTRLQVEPGWEPALEAALRERLAALAVGRVELVRAFADDAPPARLAFYTAPPARLAFYTAPTEPLPTPQEVINLPALASRLRVDQAQAGEAEGLQALLGDWLSGVYSADSLDEALAVRGQLAPWQAVLTRQGHAVSRHAVAFYAADSEQAGLLARAQEIDKLDQALRAQSLIAEAARSAQARAEAALSALNQQLQAARGLTAQCQSRAHQGQVQLLQLEQQTSAAQARRGQLDADIAEIGAQQAGLAERRAIAEAALEALDQQLAVTQQRQADLDEAAGQAERQLADAREQLRGLERQAQEAQFQARSLLARRSELQRTIATALAQAQASADSAALLDQELQSLDDSAAAGELQAALAARLLAEQRLGASRSHYDGLSAQLRAADEQRLGFERSLEPMRAQATALQLELQAAQLGGAQFLEQLAAAEVDLPGLAVQIEADGVKLWGLQGEIDRLQRELAGLGAVNLAALDELAAATERKTFLDAQNADLREAMATLEDAIRKIDLETRELLSQTFNQVNGHFGRLFPSLFGGGTARLQMTGDEILDAGVQVLAQPPGKKNSTIHLLSGGEKALTAIALVFAIFMLNPAPFCLLDEVDAPLDDANTERYSKLVSEMSYKGTQFLFISHNKIAMEMAEQLIGVTMQEQGVSRIVAVDMDAALGMAQAA